MHQTSGVGRIFSQAVQMLDVRTMFACLNDHFFGILQVQALCSVWPCDI